MSVGSQGIKLPSVRQKANNEIFYDALRKSLELLIEEGDPQKITKTNIIKNARKPNGSPVGETTLYRKNKAKELIHRAFILELEAKMEVARSRPRPIRQGRKRKTESAKATIARLRAEKRALEEENASILAQFIELEESNKEVRSSVDGNNVKLLEQELFVLASVLNRRISGCIEEISDSVERYEVKYSGQTRLAYAREEIANLERRIRDFAITPIFGKSENN
jgi:hypothetical protein